MHSATVFSVAALTAAAVAAPWQGPPSFGKGLGKPHGPPGRPHGPPAYGAWNQDNETDPEPPKQCLTQSEGEEAADVFRQLIQEYSDEVALKYLTKDFVDVSSSVNGIINAG